jgi:hypothetical protein
MKLAVLRELLPARGPHLLFEGLEARVRAQIFEIRVGLQESRVFEALLAHWLIRGPSCVVLDVMSRGSRHRQGL